LKERLRALGFAAPAIEQLLRYRADLIRFNRALNLVSRRAARPTIDRLLLESAEATLRTSWPEEGRVLDLGSGAGIPGIVIALLGPPLELTLLERRRGRADFLRRELRGLGLAGHQVLEGDAAVLGRDLRHREGYDRVTLKAVAAPDRALTLARPFLGPAGRALLFQRADWRPSPSVAADWEILGAVQLLSGAAPHSAAVYELTPLDISS
jgi:16S rRNA (guanine527-N7)-methyltransferase